MFENLKKMVGELAKATERQAPVPDNNALNQAEIDAFFQNLQGSTLDEKKADAAKKFAKSLGESLGIMDNNIEDCFGVMMNGMMDDGMLANLDNNMWELPLDVRQKGFEVFAKEIWPLRSAPFAEKEKYLQNLKECSEWSFELAPQAKAFFQAP